MISLIRGQIRPYVSDTRNLLLLRIAAEEPDEDFLATLSYSLRRPIQVEYQIEEQEIAVERIGRDQQRRIILWEAAEGGIGVWERLIEEPGAVSKLARTALGLLHFDEITGNEVPGLLIGERPLKARARRVDGGYRVTGRKMFASMLEAADFVLVMAYPDDSTSPFAGIILLLPREAEGRGVDPNWDVLGMRATRSDSLLLNDCWLPASAAVYCSDDTRPFRHAYLNWFWGSYTPVYLGIAQAAFDELRRLVHARHPEGYAQPLAYHPDVRRHVAQMSADLEAARLITYRSAWLSDTQGPTAETTTALYRAKYMVGEAVSRITRTALTLGGAHGIFKTSRLEQLFRDGALGPLHPPPSDFCLYNMGLYELGIDPADVLPPMKPA